MVDEVKRSRSLDRFWGGATGTMPRRRWRRKILSGDSDWTGRGSDWADAAVVARDSLNEREGEAFSPGIQRALTEAGSKCGEDDASHRGRVSHPPTVDGDAGDGRDAKPTIAPHQSLCSFAGVVPMGAAAYDCLLISSISSTNLTTSLLLRFAPTHLQRSPQSISLSTRPGIQTCIRLRSFNVRSVRSGATSTVQIAASPPHAANGSFISRAKRPEAQAESCGPPSRMQTDNSGLVTP
ncbi:hypothetical protein PVAR5_1386 [Paecilomyces variotii No. 5]|uniref:Uncharacterized protein n=1 Tax=Byssochlamys spectabilis (strain No. 5 / NBRC 109023) TaxID=1356009 RepID=V5HTE7_BYSSN|nr:hypothetical protein PVAR5_1386 [Paecilomyces variotii No. 5]